jgi:hypothetical protein
MRLGAPGLDEHRRDALRERQVGEVVAVQMPELAPPVAKLASPEAMVVRGDAVPRRHGGLDAVRA